jgi:HPt (histidine-containing phosphotransfer) domain-containing protein
MIVSQRSIFDSSVNRTSGIASFVRICTKGGIPQLSSSTINNQPPTASNCTRPVMKKDEEAKIDALLTVLWERNLPTLRERLDTLDRAAAAAASGHLTEASRAEALGIAHKLSGSLGMFGYHRGTEIARQIEALLAPPAPNTPSPDTLAPDAPARLGALVTELHDTLFPSR